MNAAADAEAARSGIVRAEPLVAAEYYRADIDGLRGIAVLAVLGFHAFPDQFPGGYVGVDVFFVVSGFLISTIILRQLRRSTFTIADFYARRIRRIFPALIVVLSATLSFGSLALLADELQQLGKHIASAAVFVSNFTLWRESGYFDTESEFKPLLHLWSLGIEEQFYLVWPVLLLLLWSRRRSIVVVIALLTLLSFVISVTVGPYKQIATFYFPVSRFWELGLGCLIAVLKEPTLRPERALRWIDATGSKARLARFSSVAHSVLPLLGIALVCVAVFLFDRDTPFPGWAALVPTIGAMCIVGASSGSWWQKRVLASSGLVLIGLISYPLYLWHWPMLSFAAILEAGTPDVVTRVIAVAVSLPLAWLTYKFFERPIRAQRSRRVTVALFASLALIGTAGLALYALRGFPDRFDLDVRTLRPESRMNAFCVDRFPDDAPFNYCKSTSPGQPVAVFLGDSRAHGIYEGVVDVLGSDSPMLLLGRGACPALLGARLYYTGHEECGEVWETFVRYVEETRPRVVIVAGAGSSLLNPEVAEMTDPRFDSREEALEYGLRELLTTLQKTSSVIYVRQLPQFISSPSCFLRKIKLPGNNCQPSVPRSTMEAKLAAYNRIVDRLQAEMPQLKVVDSMAALCESSVCSQRLKSGEITYSDRYHLSPVGGRYFARTSGLASMIAAEVSR
ncbi:MAG TPA: acyltransferase family protein [Steroidobacteraceae bacterium]